MRKAVVAIVAVSLATTAPLRAQSPTPAAPIGPQVGDVAPDFSLPSSTKNGVLSTAVRLSDLKGQVVVLAFFPKARTSG